MSRPSKIYEENKGKYLRAPTAEEIASVIEDLGIHANHFEWYFNIPRNTIPLVNMGLRNFPVKYWHLIFENLPKEKRQVLKQISKPKPPKPKIKRAKKKRVVMDEKILSLL